uniref:Uncharacterized protein n=1 Tax=viral metagenome TaxID=1070528 RepID=A0A6M3JK64_9ZZZZ
MLIQQGDVLFKRVDMPESIWNKLDQRSNPVLVEGEATGHHHAIATDTLLESLSDILYEDDNGDLYIRNTKEITITHQEHKPVTLPPGQWKVDRVREYDHFAEEADYVKD